MKRCTRDCFPLPNEIYVRSVSLHPKLTTSDTAYALQVV